MSLDLAFGLATLALAGGYYTLAAAIPPSLLDDVVGAQGLPRMYGILLACLGVMQVGRALMVRRRAPAGAIAPTQRALAASKIAVTLGLGIAYGAVLPWLGYAVSIALLLAATAAHQSGGLSRALVVVAVAGAAGFWLLFVWLLGIPQPAGVWSSGP